MTARRSFGKHRRAEAGERASRERSVLTIKGHTTISDGHVEVDDVLHAVHPEYPRRLKPRAARWLGGLTKRYGTLAMMCVPVRDNNPGWLITGVVGSEKRGVREEAWLCCLRCRKPRAQPGLNLARGFEGWGLFKLATPPKLRGQRHAAFVCAECAVELQARGLEGAVGDEGTNETP